MFSILKTNIIKEHHYLHLKFLALWTYFFACHTTTNGSLFMLNLYSEWHEITSLYVASYAMIC